MDNQSGTDLGCNAFGGDVNLNSLPSVFTGAAGKHAILKAGHVILTLTCTSYSVDQKQDVLVHLSNRP